MEFEEAKEILNGCVRSELRDHAFGDTEVTWMKDGLVLADGYFSGTTQTVSVIDWGNTEKSTHSFTGDEARELRECGTEGEIDRNDQMGPDTYTEGALMPGLIKEGVLTELTGE